MKKKKNEKGLIKRIAKLEWINERKERADRKNNIVIREVNWDTERLEQAVEKFSKENLAVEVKVKKANKIRLNKSKNIVIAKLFENTRTKL